MQMRHILNRAAIRDQPVTTRIKIEFRDQTRDSREQINHERGIGSREIGQRSALGFRNQQNMHRIARLGVVKREQSRGFSQAVNGKRKAHVSE